MIHGRCGQDQGQRGSSSRLGSFAFTLVFTAASGAAAQSEGFIHTRPDCVPPTNGTQQPINYIQGPDPVVLENGGIHILVDAGKCCDGIWEGIFNLYYPSGDPPATPRFFPLWATNDFGNDPGRGEHEAPFPSLFIAGGFWRVAYTTTFFPTSHPNRDRVARLDLAGLFSRVSPLQVVNRWIEPIVASCRPVGSCTGGGSGVLATAVVHPDGALFVYHPDGNYPACTSGWVRHRILADLSVASPDSHDGCLSFEGLTGVPGFVSDIGTGGDGSLYLLASHHTDITALEEWVSDPPTLGLSWHLTGRRWYAPIHPQTGWTYSVWDGAYLKDSRRRIVSPGLVVAQIADGDTWNNIVNAALGRWYLYFWAESGAPLPPHFGATAHACDTLSGVLDIGGCSGVAGWAWDSTYPNDPTSIVFYDDTVPVGAVPAGEFRQDLLDGGIGNGYHAFSSPLPGQFLDGGQHQVSIKVINSEEVLANGSFQVTCPARSFVLSVSIVGEGQGSVSSAPPGISCGSACSAAFLSGTNVSLTAIAGGGSEFVRWEGSLDCIDGVVRIYSDLQCTAVFGLPLLSDGFEEGTTDHWSATRP